jgi:uncharacterized damage-inducible protein DinB
MNRDLIEQYATGGDLLAEAVKGLTLQQLLAVPIPGKWSTQQVLIHLADAEAAFADRIRRIIAMDGPALLSWDENKFSARLHYNEQSADDAVAMVVLTRRQLGRVLRLLPDQDFRRAGEHSEKGRQTLEDVLKFAVMHMEHHLKFVAEKRAKILSEGAAGVEGSSRG